MKLMMNVNHLPLIMCWSCERTTNILDSSHYSFKSLFPKADETDDESEPLALNNVLVM